MPKKLLFISFKNLIMVWLCQIDTLLDVIESCKVNKHQIYDYLTLTNSSVENSVLNWVYF